ncbi:MAG: flagellar filament capping protein FliD [Deltaproteobacteria bacterium]|nr:flagellar filament capping protein FliD [Deltaproteobacteria bacterium]
MPISATSGLVSNIDYQGLITQLVGIQKMSLTQLTTEKTTFEKARTAYGTLSTRVQELQTAADGLRTDAGFKVFTASISDSTILGATTSSTATTGSYNIVVTNTAKAHKILSTGVAAATTTVAAGAGSFSFQAGAGAVQTVSVDAATTITSLKDSINALNAGVTASVVNDGSATNPYKLIIASNTTGAANGVTITANNTTLTFPTTMQAATDASFSVDGLTYTRSTNSVSDVITGVTLDLKAEDPAKTVTLTVNRDTASVQKKLTALVEKYNAVIGYVRANNRYDSNIKLGGPFFGDSVARSIQDDLRRVMSSAVSGLPGTMNRLLHAGITSDRDGVFSVDATKLTSALASNFDDVVNMFTDTTATKTTKGFGGLIYDMANNITNAVDGRITNRQSGLTKNITNIERDIKNKEAQLEAYEERIRGQFTALETMLASLKQQSSYLAGL